MEAAAPGFVIADEEIELRRDPDVQGQKRQLKSPPEKLRAVPFRAGESLFFGEAGGGLALAAVAMTALFQG